MHIDACLDSLHTDVQLANSMLPEGHYIVFRLEYAYTTDPLVLRIQKEEDITNHLQHAKRQYDAMDKELMKYMSMFAKARPNGDADARRRQAEHGRGRGRERCVVRGRGRGAGRGRGRGADDADDELDKPSALEPSSDEQEIEAALATLLDEEWAPGVDQNRQDSTCLSR